MLVFRFWMKRRALSSARPPKAQVDLASSHPAARACLRCGTQLPYNYQLCIRCATPGTQLLGAGAVAEPTRMDVLLDRLRQMESRPKWREVRHEGH